MLLLAGPGANIADAAAPIFVFIALLAPLFYATESNLVALWGTDELDAVQTLLGASIVTLVFALPLALSSGQWINPLEAFGKAEAALALSAVIHGLVYAGYVWLIGRAGSVFAAQLSYMVNGFGGLWGCFFWERLTLSGSGPRLASRSPVCCRSVRKKPAQHPSPLFHPICG